MSGKNALQLVVEVDTKSGNASIKGLNKNFSSMERQAVTAAKNSSAGINSMSGSLSKLLKIAGGTAALIGAYQAIKRIGQATFQAMDDIAKTGQRIGLSIQTYAEYKHVADLAGVSAEKFGAGLSVLSKNMLDATRGNNVYRQTFRDLQIDYRNADGTLRNVNDVIEDLADRFRGMNDETKKVAIARTIMGRSGAEMITALNQGSAAIREQREEARKLGIVLSDDAAKSAEKFNDNISRLKSALQGVAYRIAEDLLPRLIDLTDRMVQWAKEGGVDKLAGHLKTAAEWAKNLGIGIVSYGVASGILKIAAAAKTAAVAIGAMNVAALANPWGLVAVGIGVFGWALWREYDRVKKFTEGLRELNRQADIRAGLQQGKTLEQIKAAGYTESQIRDAASKDYIASRPPAPIPDIGGPFARVTAPGFEWTRPDSGGGGSLEDLNSRVDAANKAALELRRAAEESLLRVPARTIRDIQKEIEKLTTYVDEEGVQRKIKLSSQARENVEQALQIRIRSLLSETSKHQVEDYRQASKEIERLSNLSEKAKADAAMQIEIALAMKKQDLVRENAKTAAAVWKETAKERHAFEQTLAQKSSDFGMQLEETRINRASIQRDAAMRQLDMVDPQTPEQMAALEAKRADIEIEYIRHVHAVKTNLFDIETHHLETQWRIQSEILQAAGADVSKINRMIDDLKTQRQQLRTDIDEWTAAEISAARDNAVIRQAQIVRSENQRTFEAFKRQAEGVFDTLQTKSKNAFSAIGDYFKTAMLTAIKEIVTSHVARMLTQLFSGARLPVAGGAGGVGMVGMLGGAVPSLAGGGGISGVGIPGAGSGTGSGGVSGLGNMLNLGGIKSFLGMGNKVIPNPLGLGSSSVPFSSLSLGGKLSAIGHSPAALLGGGMLALAGLQRGGVSGLGMATAGGALMGYKFGGPLGAAIGGAIGLGAGLIRLGHESPEEQARKAIKSSYGVDVHTKSILQQVVEIAKQSYGGNIRSAVKSSQVQELVRLYAMTTGQDSSRLQRPMTATNLIQSGGGLRQQAQYYNGLAMGPLAGAIPSYARGSAFIPRDQYAFLHRGERVVPADDNQPLPGASLGSRSSGGDSPVPMQVTNISIPGAKDFFENETVSVIGRNGRAVMRSSMSAIRQNFSRRESIIQQVSPGTLVS